MNSAIEESMPGAKAANGMLARYGCERAYGGHQRMTAACLPTGPPGIEARLEYLCRIGSTVLTQCTSLIAKRSTR